MEPGISLRHHETRRECGQEIVENSGGLAIDLDEGRVIGGVQVQGVVGERELHVHGHRRDDLCPGLVGYLVVFAQNDQGAVIEKHKLRIRGGPVVLRQPPLQTEAPVILNLPGVAGAPIHAGGDLRSSDPKIQCARIVTSGHGGRAVPQEIRQPRLRIVAILFATKPVAISVPRLAFAFAGQVEAVVHCARVCIITGRAGKQAGVVFEGGGRVEVARHRIRAPRHSEKTRRIQIETCGCPALGTRRSQCQNLFQTVWIGRDEPRGDGAPEGRVAAVWKGTTPREDRKPERRLSIGDVQVGLVLATAVVERGPGIIVAGSRICTANALGLHEKRSTQQQNTSSLTQDSGNLVHALNFCLFSLTIKRITNSTGAST